MSSPATTWNIPASAGWSSVGWLLRPIQLGIAFPALLYLTTLTVFLFKPPDLELHYADRIAFGVLVFFVALRSLALRECLPFVSAISLPMLGLISLAVARAWREPYDPTTWSLVASKFVVPFVLMHIAMLVFHDRAARRQLEIFVLLALAYLVFMALAFLAGASALIFPRSILDSGLGHHIDRARGPLLQAVANGLALNLLGILALALAPARRTLVRLLWLLLPLAIFATMTRTAWIAFVLSTVALAIRIGDRCLRRACAVAAVAGIVLLIFIGLGNGSWSNAFRVRTGERGPVEARLAVYQAGWEMFVERPLTGWTSGSMYAELAHRMPGYHLRSYYAHNTYLALLVEFGLPGLLLYGMLLVGLFRQARADWGDGAGQRGAVSNLRKAWPILLTVYLLNACFVDMVYQFINALLFTAAGVLCASRKPVASR